MTDFLNKLENFLFDIIGLVLPGFIFLLIFIAPIYFVDFPISSKIETSYILSTLDTLKIFIQNQVNINTPISATIIVIISYLLGHVVKVFSIIVYEFLTAIFDKNINVVVELFFNFIKNGIKWIFNYVSGNNFGSTTFYRHLKIFILPFKNSVAKIFTFKSPDYFPANENLKIECIKIINQKLSTNYPPDWYSVYKFSTIISTAGNNKSLAPTFLAKYNLYRSLSFIFLFTAVYIYLFFNISGDFLSPELKKIEILVVILSLIFWFTFNYKYKRYWTLCGNETLVSLYYYLNKNLI